MSPAATLEFWYDLASPYAYLSAMRIEALALAGGVTIVWRPFLLGPIFSAQGWPTSPFVVYPAKGRYMARDMARLAAERRLAFRLPPVFPARSITAARIAVAGLPHGWTPAFTKAVFTTEFSTAFDIGDRDVLADILTSLGLDAKTWLDIAQSAEIKQQLRDFTATAQARDLFGAPTFVTADQDLFWGDDRLEQSISWARRLALLH